MAVRMAECWRPLDSPCQAEHLAQDTFGAQSGLVSETSTQELGRVNIDINLLNNTRAESATDQGASVQRDATDAALARNRSAE